METLADRIRIRRKELGLTQKELAKKIGVTQGVVGQLERGMLQGTRKTYALATALAVDIEWLLTGNKNIIDENGRKVASNSSGFVSFPDIPIQFYNSFIKELGLNETQLSCIQQTDDSMLPSIYDSDYLLCDTQVKMVQENAVFRIKRKGQFITRRIVFDRFGAVIYRCDNPNKIKWQDIYATPDDEVIGKIVWSGGFRQFV